MTGYRVDHEAPRHEKIRFRRDEITDLGAMPSAAGQDMRPGRPAFARRLGRRLAALLGFMLLAGIVIVGAAIAIGMSGFGSEKLRLEAERAISTAAGVDIDAALGPARISFDGARLLALDVSDVSLKNGKDGASIIDAGNLRFGVRFLPLLGGNIRLGSVTVSDARISTAALPVSQRSDWTEIFRDDRGLLDPDRLVSVVFEQVHNALDAVQAGSTRQIELANVEFVLPEKGRIRIVRIVDATLAASGPGSLSFNATAEIDGRAVTLKGNAARDAVSRRITALSIDVLAGGAETAAAEPPRSLNQLGGVALSLKGQEGIGGQSSQLSATLALDQSVLDLGARGAFAGNVNLDTTLVAGSRKIEINRLHLETGRTRMDFNGAVGPKPPGDGPGEAPAYRYELVSTNASLAPAHSPEPAVELLARASGIYDPATRRLTADEIALKSGPGEAVGTASATFVEGKAPGIVVAFNVHDMQVSHAKQLWPWFAAKNARLWVFSHVFGGRAVDGRVQFQVMPGRLGDGVPLSAEEVFGRFEIAGSRFDTAGLIPPVRDANGVVEFRGHDVDISLSSGTVYMPSGRNVAASNGTLTVRAATHPPVIGKLDIDVAGDAAAITELVSYEPINAMRHIGLSPNDFSGQVSGNVKADIPLQKGVDSKTLDWLVALDYTGLTVAKPFDGQQLSDATGTITVDPGKAILAAKGKLNGVPAQIDVVEPLRPDGPERERKVEMVLDDKAREILAPGLSTIVSGSMKVALDAHGPSREIKADLTNATLDIPWAGWSKGPGIAATASFVLEKSGTVSTLSDFKLTGKTFSVVGEITVADGVLAGAKFSSVKLNRSDDVAVTIKRSGKSYAVAIKGSSLDARSLIKQVTSDVGAATKSTSGSVSVSLDVDRLAGFHDESFSSVKLDYSGTGSKVNSLDVQAVAGSGSKVTIQNSAAGGQRKMQIQSADAGALLRFLNIYEHMQGGAIKLTLAGNGDGPMKGQVDARNFFIVDEPRLASIVTTAPAGGDRSLNQAVRGDLDASRAQFERGFAQIDKGDGYLKLDNGVLRGPMIGTTFQGTLYDKAGKMAMTGTFMPAYGLNRIFGELPLIGAILGNGRDRGLIGVTYRLSGNAKAPKLDVNPLSVIAPGIFRSIFEY